MRANSVQVSPRLKALPWADGESLSLDGGEPREEQAGEGRVELEVPGDNGRKLVLYGVGLFRRSERGCRQKLGGLMTGP